ncbi:MAG: hypothetical protein Q4G50_13580 [Corynebacterium sp.]|uniref:hypothetical protein n=1 Tax=Corynebacterium sp. TaxID=1720 RepID=UPI0026DF33D2|nr:hypothetical protein [Corynebacterium sp.]MDO5671016.1 hypothetical protein [Corynebacterium sp.]
MNVAAIIASVMAMVTSLVGGVVPAASSLPIPAIVHDWLDWDDHDDDWDDDWDDDDRWDD